MPLALPPTAHIGKILPKLHGRTVKSPNASISSSQELTHKISLGQLRAGDLLFQALKTRSLSSVTRCNYFLAFREIRRLTLPLRRSLRGFIIALVYDARKHE